MCHCFLFLSGKSQVNVWMANTRKGEEGAHDWTWTGFIVVEWRRSNGNRIRRHWLFFYSTRWPVSNCVHEREWPCFCPEHDSVKGDPERLALPAQYSDPWQQAEQLIIKRYFEASISCCELVVWWCLFSRFYLSRCSVGSFCVTVSISSCLRPDAVRLGSVIGIRRRLPASRRSLPRRRVSVPLSVPSVREISSLFLQSFSWWWACSTEIFIVQHGKRATDTRIVCQDPPLLISVLNFHCQECRVEILERWEWSESSWNFITLLSRIQSASFVWFRRPAGVIAHECP